MIPVDPDQADPRDRFFDVSALGRGLEGQTGRSAVTVMLFAVAKIAVALGSTAMLARLVPPAQQGIVAMAMPAVLIASGLSEFGLAQAVVQRPHVTHRLASTLLWTNVALGLSLAIIVALLGVPAARFYDTPETTAVFIGMSPYIFFSVLTAQYVAVLRRQMRIRQIEVGSLGATFAASGIAILAAMAGAGYWALAIQLVLAEFLNLIYLLVVSRWLPSSPLSCRFGEARAALNFGGFLAGERLLGEFARNMQVIVIGRMFTQIDAALFFRSQTIAQMPLRRIASPLSGAFIPALSRLQGDPAAFRAMYVRQISRANLIMVPIGLIFCSCADVLVRVMLGSDWTAAAPILAWLGLLPLTALTLSSFSWVMVACGQSKALFKFRIFGTSLLILALFIGSRLGVVGLVAAYVVTLAFVQGPILAALVLRCTPLTLASLRSALLGEALFATLSLALLMAVRRMLTLDYALQEALVVVAVLALLYALRLMSDAGLRDDVAKVLQILRR
ncbi:Membrane protein involved in the export of O-antigen and teichoic acid [Loktanella atrilutea]|uniref:Membrane protein involved in the export of O-antigen and teichoic acid n=1 Tax=Loktanella atrilutea TaxID=366533 RepID=A0A1M5F3I2_LOKAT|nr:lipopolysaccharide biosynthesis protein [Loktanella atrilutea]SHF86119.1 Membrane protein involved in the export of O-antigen and teichoic acid [Loktanella atrilutea]